MPLYKRITPNQHSFVYIWKIDESLDELLNKIQLKPESQERVDGMKSIQHQRGFLSVRMLLAAAGYSDFDLFYDEEGKPHLKDGKHISITHSFSYSGIIVSDENVGIDIEMQREKIEIIAHKFLKYEFEYTSEADYVRMLTVIWGAKEAIYKMFPPRGLSFKDHIKVIPFKIGDQAGRAWAHFEEVAQKYQLEWLEFDGYTCVYSSEEGL
ncbi:4'-phosphopantetheinyl transferase family protein [Spongiivirga citrea]|uniref:4'-phosphopantetheinyl transferase superfamily protein n=1 Tax=Spongiivirga citrea TaxID=1481457 RepID=A0A6M0CT63_9FLAO|nr:4'-phosphopantetheinyl transferase superfamily protein [Spongiivirga citrea]NER17000.1 4'-phosphopantetheinyl transferase superfamily protein [Spongiivirga citrea]